MEKFAPIYDRAAERHGGKKAVARMMPKVRSPRALSATKNDRWLAEMTRCIFQAGFVWRVINQKWDDFEDVFFGFPPDKVVMLSPDQIDRSQSTSPHESRWSKFFITCSAIGIASREPCSAWCAVCTLVRAL